MTWARRVGLVVGMLAVFGTEIWLLSTGDEHVLDMFFRYLFAFVYQLALMGVRPAVSSASLSPPAPTLTSSFPSPSRARRRSSTSPSRSSGRRSGRPATVRPVSPLSPTPLREPR